MVSSVARANHCLPVLLLAALLTSSCFAGDRSEGADHPNAVSREGSRVEAPSEVADCQPCTVAIRTGEDAPVWAFTFDIAQEPGGARLVRSIAAAPIGQLPPKAQLLAIPDMAPVLPEQDFFFGPQDLDLDGWADLVFATDRGVANAYARYWRYDPATRDYVDLGTFPILAMDPATHRISSYERDGSGGIYSTRTYYAWAMGKLEPARVEESTPAGQPGAVRLVVRERQDGVLVTIEDRVVRRP